MFGLPHVTFGLPLVTFGLPLVTFGLPLVTFGLPLVTFGITERNMHVTFGSVSRSAEAPKVLIRTTVPICNITVLQY